MYKYFYTLNADGSIFSLLKQKKAPKNSVQITKEEYDSYLSIFLSVPDKEGFEKNVKLYPDFTYTVDYTPIVETIIGE